MKLAFSVLAATRLLLDFGGAAEILARDAAWVNVKDFGAVGDSRMVTDAWMHAGSPTITSASAHFTQKDVGQPMTVLGAGSRNFPEIGTVAGAPLETRVEAVIDASTAKLAEAAQQEISGARAIWGADDSG